MLFANSFQLDCNQPFRGPEVNATAQLATTTSLVGTISDSSGKVIPNV